jgi:thiamine biosynthesis lipoprotein ApbE
MEADALATVFMVMPPGDALRLAGARHSPALLISRAGSEFRLSRSPDWPQQ